MFQYIYQTTRRLILFTEELSKNEMSDYSVNMIPPILMKLHDRVIVKYEFVLYPECIAQINGDEIEVSMMHMAEGHLKRPKFSICIKTL